MRESSVNSDGEKLQLIKQVCLLFGSNSSERREGEWKSCCIHFARNYCRLMWGKRRAHCGGERKLRSLKYHIRTRGVVRSVFIISKEENATTASSNYNRTSWTCLKFLAFRGIPAGGVPELVHTDGEFRSPDAEKWIHPFNDIKAMRRDIWNSKELFLRNA